MATAVQPSLNLALQAAQQQQHQQQQQDPQQQSIATPESVTGIEEFLNLPPSALAHTASASAPAPASAKQQSQTQSQHRQPSPSPSPTQHQQPAKTTKQMHKPADIQTLATNAPIAAASLANGPPPPGSSPEVLFRYYLASELRRMGSPFDDSVIDKYVKQHTKTLDAARKAGSVSPAARLSPAPSSAVDGVALTGAPSSGAAAASAANVVSAANLLNGLIPPLAVSLTPSPFTLTASGMGNHASASIDTAAIFSPAMVGSSLPPASINPNLVHIAPASASSTTTTAAPLTNGATSMASTSSVKNEPRTPKVPSADLMDESDDSDGGIKDEDDDDDDVDEDDDEDSSMDRRERYGSENTSPSTSMQSANSKASSAHGKKVSSMSHSAFASPISILGVPASLAAISEDLRPSAEEYKRLSSKEKRQLRNKISARNFRTRRKEYIGQLEDQIADRDQIIEGLRQQVAQLTVVNRGLDEEVKTLKARTLSQTDVSRILDALQKNIGGAGMNPVSAASAAAGLSAMSEMGPPAAPIQHAGPTTVTLPTLAGPALARTPMRNSNSSTSLSDFFGGITNRPGTPMQTSRPSTPLSPLFPALGATSVSGAGNGSSSTSMIGFSPSLRPSFARRPSPASFNLGGSSSGSSSNSTIPTLGHAGPITQPNTKKDVAPNASADSFWAGSSSGLSGAPGSSPFGAGAGGFMQVHMTLVDELLFPAPTSAMRSQLPTAAAGKGTTSTAASKLAEVFADKLRQTHMQRATPQTLTPATQLPAYSSSRTTTSSGSDIKKTTMTPSTITRRSSIDKSDVPVTSSARVEVEDAFMRLLFGEGESEVEAEVLPTYQEATRTCGHMEQTLLSSPVPVYCKA
ncbi:hypothetical protein CF327_g6588 [Tilletia walkeri]|nr:hypothetical protein CF327_g6588 [Tilletia walkeri]